MKAGNPSEIARKYLEHGRSEDCPIIDMHGHWGPYGGGYFPAADPEVMIATLKRCGVEKIVCSSHESLMADVERGNGIMQQAIDRWPEALLGYWSINPNYPELAARAAEDFEKARGFVGFKFLPDYHTYPITGKRNCPALEYADQRGLLALVHTWGGSAYNSPAQLEEVARKYPHATFIMGHSGYGDWETSLRIARELPNVYLELTAVYVCHDFGMFPSGSGTPAPLLSYPQVNGIIELMVQVAGSRKVLFGTDLPWYSPLYAAGAVLFARISDDDRRNILHRNARRLLSAFVGERSRGK